MASSIAIIGGTDSSGGAGLGADEETILDYKCNSFAVISAITFQKSHYPPRIIPVPQAGLKSQLDSLLEQPLDVIKIGMLPNPEAVAEVVTFLDQVSCDKVILDPVKKTSSGYELISEAGWISLIGSLFPKVHLLTPNTEEALSSLELSKQEGIGLYELAEKCLTLRPQAVLLKGGHFEKSSSSTDILITHGQKPKTYNYDRLIGGTQIRGTGCRLASAIACEWAKCDDLATAIEKAGNYLQTYLRQNLP